MGVGWSNLILFCEISLLTFQCVTLKCMAGVAFHTNCRLDKPLKPKRWSIYINSCELSEQDSRTSGRPFSEGAPEGCEVTGWLYFISALRVLFLTIIFSSKSHT